MAASEGDAFLIDAVQRGDSAAWNEVIDRYQGRLLSFAKRMLSQPSDAEDLVQDTFVGLLRSLPTYDPERSLETYLFAILRHKLNDYFRKMHRGQRQSLDQLDLDDTPAAWVEPSTPSTQMADQESLDAQRGALVHCLRQWVEQCETMGRFQELMVVEMLMVVGLRNKEVAADLSLTETAVAGVKFRVLERWRELTGQEIRDHEWSEADLASSSTVARIWREEGVSCPKRSTLGRHLLGALEDEWNGFIEFHVKSSGCDRCNANLDDLRSEDERDIASREKLRERCFASSVGFLSRRPD